MAQRRMFSKEVTNSSDFQMMSHSAQALYFHIGMNADDDGFCEIFTVIRMTESKPDDIRALSERGLIYVVDSKVAIVKDWHENNNIQNDRYNKSKYLSDPKMSEIYSMVMAERIKHLKRYQPLLQTRIQDVSIMDTQVRIGKVRIGKEKDTGAEAPSKRFIKPTIEEVTAYCSERKNKVIPSKFINHYESNGWKVGRNPMKDWKAAVRTWEQSKFDNNKPEVKAPIGKYDKFNKSE